MEIKSSLQSSPKSALLNNTFLTKYLTSYFRKRSVDSKLPITVFSVNLRLFRDKRC